MRIVYDYQAFAEQQYGGISRYVYEIAKRIGRTSGCDVRVLAPLYVNAYAAHLQKQLLGLHVPMIPRTRRLVRRLNGAMARYLLARNRPDILHETYYSGTTAAPAGVPIVITVHDMIHEKFAAMLPARDATSRHKALAVRRADHIICVSENTKKDLLEILGPPEEKVSVVYLGCDFEENEEAVSVRMMGHRQPILLYVGARASYKNFSTLLRAYAASSRLKNDFRIACFGGPPFSAEEMQAMCALGIHARVARITGDDATLRGLYCTAACLVYPSLYEGFGIPLAEAMACGCPVICSRVSSLPEVGGDAAEYFDPTEPDSLIAATENVVYSAARSSRMIERGEARAAQFTWDRCARETLSVYSLIASNHDRLNMESVTVHSFTAA